jgi:3',5'-cyclic AMP phosphodiesterase CpdA
MGRTRVGLVSCLVVLGCLAPPAHAAPTTTVQRTIQDCDGDNLLEYTFGEEHVPFGSPFDDEGCTRGAREGEELQLPNPASILNFLQLSDFQTVDEESPGRVEFLDGTQRAPGLQPFSAAYRPQEALSTQVVESMVRQARNTTSPVTGERLDLTILTGDNADSQQYNETRWFIDMLDGTTGDGNPDPEMETPGTSPGADRKLDPNSGIPTPGCEATPGSIYDGVRDDGQPGPDDGYYEPDSSAAPRDDGDGYSPNRARNQAEVGRDVTVRDFPGLLERANEPFESVGLGMPWYTAFGNHDALVQGNDPGAYVGPLSASGEVFNPVFHAIVTGCVKVKQPSPDVAGTIAGLTGKVAELREDGVGSLDEQEQIDRLTSEALGAAMGALTDSASTTVLVPPDPRRCYVAKDDNAVGVPAGLAPGPCSTGSWIHQHFRTTGTPVGHGLAPSDPADCAKYGPDEAACRQASSQVGPGLGRPPQAVANHDGYYSFVPKPGLRFVVLDTITDECGALVCSEGSVDDTQFQWLRDQIEQAASAGQYVTVFSHHTLRTTRFPSTDPSEQPEHFGERVDRRGGGSHQGGQPIPPSPGQTLEELYCEHPNVIAHVSGHEHENYVDRHDCARDDPPTPGSNPVFWHISTAAHIDFPQQARMIELVDDHGEMKLVLTMLDHEGAANPGSGNAPLEPPRHASIARELAYNDYQGSRGAKGGRQDRNVILDTERPPPPSSP